MVKSGLRLVYVGTGHYSVPVLEAIVAAGHQVGLVIAPPSGGPVRRAAERLGLRVKSVARIAEAATAISEADPDLIVVKGFGQRLPHSILGIPRRGVLNIHGSLLPRYRGPAPIPNAIRNRDRSTGVTVHLMDEEFDHGPILAQREVEIEPDDDVHRLAERLARAGAQLIVETLAGLDRIQPRDQDHAAATEAPWVDAAQLRRRKSGTVPRPGSRDRPRAQPESDRSPR